ncbi:MAG TPA: DUF1786 family protein [Candidatus Limnocylindrales bacterium]|nr:DUF1786 family protein [Candidatus Limnocylindrales bacterium]
MRVLAIDVGTGTQDILLFDSRHEIENCVRLVLPSPTVQVAERIRRATRARWQVVLTGSTMGGGPSHWAARDHAAAGLPIFATADAARTFDDDLAAVEAMGIHVVDHTEAARRAEWTNTDLIRLGDIGLDEVAAALAPLGVVLSDVDALALAVFDHGAAPPGTSDRRFRFERLAERLEQEPETGPAAFAFLAADLPPAFTRLQAAARAGRAWLGESSAPLLLMDTAPAAALGLLDDTLVRETLAAGRPLIVVNVGNFHVFGLRLAPAPGSPTGCRIEALFEHHTGELDAERLAGMVARLADGSLTNEDVFESMGHGALRLTPPRTDAPALLAVTGPRRAMLAGRDVPGLGRPHLAAPHGDMMQTGPFGLLRALAVRRPDLADTIAERLGPAAAA